ncbi:solute carrier family 49 member 4 homolog [Saccostrea echinata]|uniref:solute carrier family 49 member 4 homolog n=1 Tax=Saccostrea echinata TaxID=191078 RepID=UPI002A82DD7C|nr:solute carrier family 49 member 4 homolog [Saccostrea echinata]
MSVSESKGVQNHENGKYVQRDESSSCEEEQPLLQKTEKFQTYERRWYVLAVFSMACFLQAAVWNTWGPITQSAEVVFGWEDSQIGMLANWGNIAYIFTVFPACYFMDTRGLRISFLACTVLMLIGTGVRCITYEPKYATWMMNICAILNGIAGTVPFAGPAQVANTWFPPHQRTTATAIASIFNYGGVAMAFVIGPQLVSSPKYKNVTHIQNNTPTFSRLALDQDLQISHSLRNVSNSSLVLINFTQIRHDILYLMYYEFAAVGLLFLCSLTMPSKPPTPPSISASTQRVEYKKALLTIGRNRAVWLIGLAYALPAGVYGVWGAVIDVILKPVGIEQTEVGWIGFYSIMAGCVSGLAIGRFSDVFMRHMKLFLLVMFGVAGGSFVWFTLMCVKVIPLSTVQVYISNIMGGMFLNGAIPLFYELGAESAFPVSEGVIGGFLTWLNNMFGILFLFMLQIPGIGTDWMNWTLVGSVAIGLAFLFVFPERYTRTDIDICVDKAETDHPETTIIVRQTVYENI